MNTTLNTSLFVIAFAVLATVFALPARASDFAVRVSMADGATVVEVLDEAQLERELGECSGRYYIRARVGSGVRTFDLSSGRAVIAPTASSAPYVAPQFFCGGENRGFPTSVDYR